MIIKNLEPKDYDKVIEYAIEGMNFRQYFNHELALRLYGRYFLYLELNKVTDAYAAYGDNGEFLGTLLLIRNKEKKAIKNCGRCFTLPFLNSYSSSFLEKVRGNMIKLIRKCWLRILRRTIQMVRFSYLQ